MHSLPARDSGSLGFDSQDGSQGVITNLPRLDIRLGLLAAAANRVADTDTLHASLLEPLDGQRLTYRQLDGTPFDPRWVLDGFP
jgi:hypothetical protein